MDLSKLNESLDQELEEGVLEVKERADDDDVKDGPGDMSSKTSLQSTKEEEEIMIFDATIIVFTAAYIMRAKQNAGGYQHVSPDENGHISH